MSKIGRRIAVCLIILTFILVIQGLVVADSQATKQWTVMVYCAADNDLSDYGLEDLNEMELAGSTDQVNMIFLLDRLGTNNTHLYYVLNDPVGQGTWDDPIVSSLLDTLADSWLDAEEDMSDPQTLQDFAIWTMQAYPAEKVALVIWDHGTGIFKGGIPPLIKGECYDVTDSPEGGYIDLNELNGVLAAMYAQNGNQKIDIVGHDANLMGQIETYYQMMPYVDIGIASEATEHPDGWDYAEPFKALKDYYSMTSIQLAQKIVEDFSDRYEQINYPYTVAAVHLQLFESYLVPAINEFATILRDSLENYRDEITAARESTEYYDYIDYPGEPRELYHFAELISENQLLPDTLVNAASMVMDWIDWQPNVILAEEHGGYENAHGMTIWFPDDYKTNPTTLAYEEDISFSQELWDEFLWDFDDQPWLSYSIEEPAHWYHPPIKVQPGVNRIILLRVYNRNEETIGYTCFSDNEDCIIGAYSDFLDPGESVGLPFTLIGSGTCGSDSAIIDGNVLLYVGEDEEYSLPVLAIVSDDYYECPRDPQTVDTLDNGVLKLCVTACGDQRIYDVGTGTFPFNEFEVFHKSGPIVATTWQGDTLVGRFMPEDWYMGAFEKLYTDECNVDYEPDYWLTYTKDVFIHDLEPPTNTRWWWWELSRQIKFYKEDAPDYYKHLVIEYVRVKVKDPPTGWPNVGNLEYEDTFIGVAEDINCPWGSGAEGTNLGGYDNSRYIAWQRGYDGYDDYYCGVALAVSDLPGETTVPYGSYCVRSDQYLYPQDGWGWNDGELYQLASTQWNTIQNEGDPLDRAYVMTARKIDGGTSEVSTSFTIVRVVAPEGLGQLQDYVDSARAIVDRTGFGTKTGLPAICGDVNGNGLVNVGDPTYLLSWLYKGGSPPLCPMNRADVNSDGNVNQGDVIYLLNYLFQGGPKPICPGIWFP